MKYRITLTILALLLIVVVRTFTPLAPGDITAQVLEPPSELGELTDVIWSANGKTLGLTGDTVNTALFDISDTKRPEFIETIEGFQPRLSPNGTQLLTAFYKMGAPIFFDRHFPGDSRERERLDGPEFRGALSWVDDQTVMAFFSSAESDELSVIDIDAGPTHRPKGPFLPVKYRDPGPIQRMNIARDSQRASATIILPASFALAPGHIGIKHENGAISVVSKNRAASFTLPKAYEPLEVVDGGYLLATRRYDEQRRLSVFDLSGKRPRIDLGDFNDVAAAPSGHIIIEDTEGRRYLTRFQTDRLQGRRELRFVDRGGNPLTPMRISLSPDGSRVVFATAQGSRLYAARIRAD